MNFIKHIVEFNKLKLIWQASVLNDASRMHYIVGELIRNGDEVRLEYLTKSSDFKKAQAFGFDGYPAFRIDEDIHTSSVLEAFMSRLPPRTRGDVEKYLEVLRLPPNVDISKFALLGYSGAKLVSDGFSIVPSFEFVSQPCEFLMEVAGFRFIQSNIPIELGMEVSFEKEPDNKIDSNAIRILVDKEKIGYIPRSHLSAFHKWLKKKRHIKAVVERRNGQPDSPVLYLFIEVGEEL